jgi:hypothetical protein
MRVIMLVQFPIEPFNTATRNGTVGAKMKQILDAIKPEARLFHRTGRNVAAVSSSSISKSASDIPKFAEPLFVSRIAMTPEDLAA